MERINSLPGARPALRLRWMSARLPLALLALLAIGLWHLDAPAAWWDEGWTMSVAQNWVRYGHYGRLLDGRPAPHGLEAAFPATALVALSFRAVGVGLWQARLVGVLCTIAALTLLWMIARRLYNRATAWATLGTLLLLSAHPQLHPLIIGRQVLAEMPMLMYLLAGYLACLAALRGRTWLLALAMLGWALGICAKAQALPFWLLSLLLPLLAALYWRQWRMAGLLAAGLVGAYVAARGLIWLQALLLRGHTLPATPLDGLYQVIALVLDWPQRWFALQTTLTFGLPTLLGLGYAGWRALGGLRRAAPQPEDALRLALLSFAGSWLGWYALLSIGSPRYLFPATFVGGLFVAALLADLTDQFALGTTLRRATGALRQIDRRGLGALAAIVLIAALLPLSALVIVRNYGFTVDTDARDVTTFLNTQTPPDALIETYDSELHVALERRFHYPPDQIHIELIRRSMAGAVATVQYDPLAADPDYLVVGSFNRRWQLYDQAIAAGAFRPIQQFGQYQVYERVR
jgi:hypothetical protein